MEQDHQRREWATGVDQSIHLQIALKGSKVPVNLERITNQTAKIISMIQRVQKTQGVQKCLIDP